MDGWSSGSSSGTGLVFFLAPFPLSLVDRFFGGMVMCLVWAAGEMWWCVWQTVLDTDNQKVNFDNDNPITPIFKSDNDNPIIIIQSYRKLTIIR